MTHKKKCKCGFLVVAASARGAGDGIKEHCAYTEKCEAMNAKNV